jgi:REP element-mobilizing transposase RayT
LIDHRHRSLVAAHRIYFHLTWSTYRRMPMIDGPTRDFLDGFFRRIEIQERAGVIALGLLRTHVHLLVESGPRIDLSRLVQLLKGGSSYAASRQPDNRLGLRWNREYSVTTVSPKLLTTAIEYIKRQNERHPSEVIPR